MNPTGNERPAYKPTMFDRHGPAAADRVRAGAYGLMVFGLAFGAFALAGGGTSIISTVIAAIAAATVAGASLVAGKLVGDGWRVVAYDGASTPYQEQYSYQQSLVMAGKLDEALESFEAVIAEAPDNVDVRIRAAELYAREKGDPKRAAQLFREAQRSPSVTPGQEVYLTNRLVDLLTGPLGEPARALGELRRLIDRHPTLPATAHAREALARIKSRLQAGEP